MLHRDDVIAGVDDLAVDRAMVVSALKQLSDDDREALLLVGWDGLSHADAAIVAGCSVVAFKARVNRARSRLIRLIDPPRPTLLRLATQEV